LLAKRLGVVAPWDLATHAALGGVAAALGLVFGAGRRGVEEIARADERVALMFAVVSGLVVAAGAGGGAVASGVIALLGVTLALIVLARRWSAEWPVYGAPAALVGTYFVYRAGVPVPVATDAIILVLLGYLDFGIAEVMARLRLNVLARPTLYFSLAMPMIPLAFALGDTWPGDVDLFVLFSAATFYAVACTRLRRKTLGYAAAILYNVFLWFVWARVGWQLADHPPFFLIPAGLSAILFAEVNRQELGRQYVNAIRSIGLITIYMSLAVPIWQFQSFGAWLTLLLLSLLGIFVGIGLRVQSFLWLGLVCVILDVVYQLGRVGMENALARWGIMLALGILMILFVAVNEKKRIGLLMFDYYQQVRQWE
jgi:hypothetical protein